MILLMLVFIQMGRNPILTAGCYGILKSVQENPESAMEALDFSVNDTYSFNSMRFSANLLLFKYLFIHFSVHHSL